MSTRLPKAVFLDLDDTILDDSGNVTECWNTACRAHCSELGRVEPEQLLDAIERTREWYWADAERHRIGRLDLSVSRAEVVRLSLAEIGMDAPVLAQTIADTYAVERDLGLQPFDDAVDTVRWLKAFGCRLALITNGAGTAQRTKIDRFGIAPLFDRILIEGELGFGKPDPRIYAHAMSGLDIAPEDTWMVGDNLEWDVAQPQRHGIFGIWIDLQGKGVPAGKSVTPNLTIRRLSELRTLCHTP